MKYQKNEADNDGRRLDAARRVYDFAVKELSALRVLSGHHESMPHLLFLTIIIWADEMNCMGRLTESEPEYDELSEALVRLEVRSASPDQTAKIMGPGGSPPVMVESDHDCKECGHVHDREACPCCGSWLCVGYGLALGGFGQYKWCDFCGWFWKAGT